MGPGSTLCDRLFPRIASPVEGGTAEGPPAVVSPIGVELDHFIIDERIGVGGMGAVFRARDTRLGRGVALKVLSPVQSLDQGAVQRFRNEARAAAGLDHDNIARAFYVGEDRGLHFIAFEYVTGTNVRDLIAARGPLDPSDAVNYTLQVASALVHTNSVGVVHRDVKPSNIIITPTGRAKLVDLGLARNSESNRSSEDLTSDGTTLGTFDYISPEQARDPRNVDVRSDIYSLGCTLYQMLTGEPPYPEGNAFQKLLDHQGKQPPDPARKNPRVSERLSSVIRRMMASDPDKRFATPEALIRELMFVAEELGLTGVSSEGMVWMSAGAISGRNWEKHIGWMATVALLVVLAVVLRFQPVDRGEVLSGGDQLAMVNGEGDVAAGGSRLPAIADPRQLPSLRDQMVATGADAGGKARTPGAGDVKSTGGVVSVPAGGSATAEPPRPEPPTSAPVAEPAAAK
ncbi:MAG TPA: serine/threonine protein kinase, partial [Planctomycetaceae bacterium]|nr:serine/threonine protein kinase [Planctomycetaceae bacterium]